MFYFFLLSCCIQVSTLVNEILLAKSLYTNICDVKDQTPRHKIIPETRTHATFFFLMNKEKYIKKKEALQGSTPAYTGGIQKRGKKPLTRA